MTPETRTTPALDAWREVIVRLNEAADRGFDAARTDLAMHSNALWAMYIAAFALELLPQGQDELFDLVALDESGLGFAEHVLNAEQITRRHPIEEFPPGASGVIVELNKLAGEITR